MSIEAYERKLFENEIYYKFKEAELEARSTNVRYTHEEVFSDLRRSLVISLGMKFDDEDENQFLKNIGFKIQFLRKQ